MTETDWDSARAWRELTTGITDLAETFLSGDKASPDEAGVVGGFKMLATLLGVGFDTYLFPDTSRPIFVEAVVPHRRDRRWGGDNTDAYYYLAPLDPGLTYRVWGKRNDSAYLSLTVYNQPSPGAWSDKIVGIANDTDLDFAPDGSFELMIGPERPATWNGTFITTTADTHCALTRDYLADSVHDTPAAWNIECVGEVPGTVERSDAQVARAFRSTLEWMRTMFSIVPMPVAVPRDERHTGTGHQTEHGVNEFGAPYQVPDGVFGWSAVDACYAFGSFSLLPGQALVITHTPPACRFWNLCLWNEYMAGTNPRDGRTSINGTRAVANSDGSVTIVLARELLDHPNAVTTMDLSRGMLAFRWFISASVPGQPVVELVDASAAPTTTF
jgi:hypothetical protein